MLPRQGQQGATLVTVNTAKVSIDVYRVGDRIPLPMFDSHLDVSEIFEG